MLDTNVLVSGFLWRGTPYRLLKKAEAGADWIVSGDPHLLRLTSFRGVDILSPDQALRKLQ